MLTLLPAAAFLLRQMLFQPGDEIRQGGFHRLAEGAELDHVEPGGSRPGGPSGEAEDFAGRPAQSTRGTGFSTRPIVGVLILVLGFLPLAAALILVYLDRKKVWLPAIPNAPSPIGDWYFAQGDDVTGPIASLALKERASKGQLRPVDWVHKKGIPGWVQAKSVKGLFWATAIASTPAAPASPPPLTVPQEPSDVHRPAWLASSALLLVGLSGTGGILLLVGFALLVWPTSTNLAAPGGELEVGEVNGGQATSETAKTLNTRVDGEKKSATAPAKIDPNSLETTARWVKSIWGKLHQAETSRNDLQLRAARGEAIKTLRELNGTQVRWQLQVSSVSEADFRDEPGVGVRVGFNRPPYTFVDDLSRDTDRPRKSFLNVYLNHTAESSGSPYALALTKKDEGVARSLSQGKTATITGRVAECGLYGHSNVVRINLVEVKLVE